MYEGGSPASAEAAVYNEQSDKPQQFTNLGQTKVSSSKEAVEANITQWNRAALIARLSPPVGVKLQVWLQIVDSGQDHKSKATTQ